MTDEKSPPKPLTPRAAGIVAEWNAGAAASDIAAMHKVSRSSILGTIHRAKVAGHHVVSKGPTGHAQREVEPRAKRQKRVDSSRVPARAAIPRQSEDEGEVVVDPNAGKYADRQAKLRAPGAGEGVPFAESGASCVWPLWGMDAKTGHVCGLPYRIAPDERGVMRPKPPYCEFHQAAAYPPRK